MKVELHCHTNRYSPCAVSTPAETMERMIHLGYEVVYITEHDAVWLDYELDQLRAGYPDIRIFPGMELSIGDESVQHLLVLGANDPEYLELEGEDDIFVKAAADGCLTVLAHPFRWEGGADLLAGYNRPDAIEYCTPNQSYPGLQQMAGEAAERLGLPLVNAGDIHAPVMMDRFWIETDQPVRNARDIRRIVLNGHYVNRSASG